MKISDLCHSLKMLIRIIISLSFVFFLYSCSKDETIYQTSKKADPYALYKEGLNAFNKNDFFFANKKFAEAELNFDIPELAAKSSIMSSFSLYGINFYDQAEENLERFLKTYPGDKNIIYAHYLIAMCYYEIIEDEKRDTGPLLKAQNKFNYINLKQFILILHNQICFKYEFYEISRNPIIFHENS